METDEQLITSVSKKKNEMDEIYFNIYEFDVKSKEEAFEYIGKRMKIPQKEYRKKRVNDLLDKYLLPHLGQHQDNRKEKALYLANASRKILRVVMEDLGEQDIDHYGYKRLRMVGDFFEILFRSLLL